MQVNHLGPYTLTRMLEPKLVASKARVVNVVSVTHRLDKIRYPAGTAAVTAGGVAVCMQLGELWLCLPNPTKQQYFLLHNQLATAHI